MFEPRRPLPCSRRSGHFWLPTVPCHQGGVRTVVVSICRTRSSEVAQKQTDSDSKLSASCGEPGGFGASIARLRLSEELVHESKVERREQVDDGRQHDECSSEEHASWVHQRCRSIFSIQRCPE